MKRIATIQDFSCVGRCSLSVALPIISAAGIECCGVPTAALSNHTGFSTYYNRDLTDDLHNFGSKFSELGITFDAIYTGYIASIEQMDFVEDFINRFGRDGAPVFVDPVMGDNGRLYSQITADYSQKIRRLCARADVITPNLTEAFLLLGEDYRESLSDSDICDMLKKLADTGAGAVVITGISKGSQIGCSAYDGAGFHHVFTEKQDLFCMGTGDIFSSAMLAALVREKPFPRALDIAVRFTEEAVKKTAADPDRRFYGVNFEQALPTLIRLMEE